VEAAEETMEVVEEAVEVVEETVEVPEQPVEVPEESVEILEEADAVAETPVEVIPEIVVHDEVAIPHEIEEVLEEEAAIEEAELHEKYDDYPREKLVDFLEAEVESGDIQAIKTKVALIKVAFLKLTREEERKHYEAHLSAGDRKEDIIFEDELVHKFNLVFEKYKEKKLKYNEEQEVLKLRNLDAKRQILEEIRELISADESLKVTYDRFRDLQVKWKEIGVVPAAEVNNMWQSYHFLVEKFFDKVKISKELRDLDLKKNLEKKIELCEKAEELLLESSILKSFKLLHKYHEECK
jgi:hypothetical protein